MYFITTFEKLEFNSETGSWDFGNIRTVGFYSDLEIARETVVNNTADLCETIYDYAVIEEVEENCLYPKCIKTELFKAVVVENGKYYDVIYKENEVPENFSRYFSLAIR